MRFESNKIYNPRALPSAVKSRGARSRSAENEYGSSSGHSKLNVTGINLWGGEEGRRGDRRSSYFELS